MTPYRVQSGVSLADFQDFVSALEDKQINISNKNIPGLLQLSSEFGFQVLLGKLASHQQFQGLVNSQMAGCQSRISALEERTGRHEHLLARLQSMLSATLQRFQTDLTRLASEVKAARDAKNSNSPLPAAPHLSGPTESPPATVSAQQAQGESLIVGECPSLFEEFRTKQWLLLWRGSRDGFTAGEFHRRCDGRANTLTLILDTKGNIFGGFTPVEWESSAPGDRYGHTKGDDSLRSFLFTLRNPHGVPPRRFALKKDKKWDAIYCCSARCAAFGWGGDIYVDDNCNASIYNYTRIGTRWNDSTYANDTAFETFFTGAEAFTVKEIEIFEIAN
jgi:hypothetical protein